ncbi:hypothetical protein ACVR1G_01540 [Streptococcus dentasini]
MKRRVTFLLGFLTILFFLLLVVFTINHSDDHTYKTDATNSSSNVKRNINVATSLKIGQTYREVYKGKHETSTYFKLVDNKNWVMFTDDGSQYKSEEDLDEAGNNEEAKVYPNLRLSLGTYNKKGNTYYLSETEHSYLMSFETVTDFKNGKYFNIKEQLQTSSKRSIILGSKGYYLKNSRGYNYFFIKSDKSIPNSYNDFLSQYTKVNQGN